MDGSFCYPIVHLCKNAEKQAFLWAFLIDGFVEFVDTGPQLPI